MSRSICIVLVLLTCGTLLAQNERWYATRGKGHEKVEAPGASHSVSVSRPKEVAALIEEAASHAR